MYFQESRFGSLDVVFVEKRSFIDEISIQNDNECVEATAYIGDKLFVMSANSVLHLRHSIDALKSRNYVRVFTEPLI